MMPTLQSPRLSIRPFRPDDEAAALLDDCFGPEPAADRAAWLEWTVRNYAALAALYQPPLGDYAVTLDGRLIGSVGLVACNGPFERLPWFADRLKQPPTPRHTPCHTPEFGLFWAVASTHRGHGYATEAAAAFAQWVFHELNLHRLVAMTSHDNAASIGVMRKLGMTVERYPHPEPPWFQTVGVLPNPTA